MIKIADVGQPAPKPVIRAVTAESDDIQVAHKSETVVMQPDKPSAPAPKASIRASRESWNAYYRELMRRRRADAKLDSVALASVDAE
jgi:cytochrome P450